ncbi:MAG TPA: hypothetical protein VJV78_24020 [Polyangiales bacterium]|nr:hypothetical protein [Polyangiales bacterium]
MPGLKVALTWIAALAAVGCIGQSGSEAIPRDPMTPTRPPAMVPPGIPPRPHCPCGGYPQSLVVRAQVVGAETFPQVSTVRYELVAQEILGQDPLGRDEIQVSDHFGGYWSGQLGCGGTAEAAKVGDVVLAFYQRGRQDGQECCEYIACTGQCAGSKVDACQESCETTTHDVCAQHSEEAVMRGQLMLIPWGDKLVVGKNSHKGNSVSIDQSQIASLTKPRDECMSELPDLFDELYPPQPPPEPPSEPASSAAGSGASTTPHGQPLPPAGSAASPMTPPPLPSTPPPLMPAQMNTATRTATPPPAGPEEVRVRCAK